MTRFYLVRHAEKDGPASLLSGRAPGLGLTPAGRTAARRLADALASEPIGRVLSSPLARARETAEPTAERLGLTLEISTALTDIDYGEWTDRTAESLVDSPAWRRHHRFRSGVRIPGGELLPDVQARFVDELLRVRDEIPAGAVAIFGHGDPIRLALAWLAGAPLDLFERFEVDYASVTTVTLTDSGVCIHEVNRRLPDVD
jgi:probable phosphoglycerate mutase